MNWLDLLILVIVGISAAHSMRRGFVREAFAILAVVLGIILALAFYTHVAKVGIGILDSPGAAKVVGFVLIFIPVVVVITVLGGMLHRFVRAVFLGWADQLAGAALGVVKGLLIVCMALSLVTAYLPESSQVMRDSRLSGKILALSDRISPLFPEEFTQALKNGHERLKEYQEKLGKD